MLHKLSNARALLGFLLGLIWTNAGARDTSDIAGREMHLVALSTSSTGRRDTDRVLALDSVNRNREVLLSEMLRLFRKISANPGG
jgi:hypothetical protein